MVDAIPTPEYDDHEYQKGLQEFHRKLEEEAKAAYYLAAGLMIWNITEHPSAVYPVRSAWDRLLIRKREYQNNDEDSIQYMTRVIKQGVCIKEEEQIQVMHKKVSLNFEITDLVMETMEKQKQEIPLTIVSMVYQGWRQIEAVSGGPSYRKPDILQFPESLIRWGDILKELY